MEILLYILVLFITSLVAVVIIFVIASVVMIPYVQANMNFIKLAPQDEPVIIKMREYSDKFGGGQQGMILVRGKSAPISDDEVRGSMRDINTLDEIELLVKSLSDAHEATVNLSIHWSRN